MRADVLEQARLDVSEKRRSNIFNWRGQFTPEFVEYLLGVFGHWGSLVVDPFCGSGTVLLEAGARRMPAAGFEINPAAYAMSKFVGFVNTPKDERAHLFQRVQDELYRLLGPHEGLPLFERSEGYRRRCKNLVEFATNLLGSAGGKKELLLGLIVLMRAETSGGDDLSSTLRRACLSVREDLLSLPFSDMALQAELCDAREAHKRCHDRADLIITSPPYINVFNYHQNYRALLEVVGFDLLKVAESEIGSNRKNRGNRFRTVVQYALDMEQCLESFALLLKPGGKLIMVVGHESNVRGVAFSNSAIIRQVADSLGCFRLEGERYRVFVNRFGKSIREDILVMSTGGSAPTGGAARQIARLHLEDAVPRAGGEPRQGILVALSEISTILASPILTRKGLI
jgi:SAM-dependent methyltransferase